MPRLLLRKLKDDLLVKMMEETSLSDLRQQERSKSDLLELWTEAACFFIAITGCRPSEAAHVVFEDTIEKILVRPP